MKKLDIARWLGAADAGRYLGTVWCGGFRFKSHRQYGIGAVVDAALPFAREGASVFSPVRIVSIEELRSEGTFAYSVTYVPPEDALPVGKPLARSSG